jgi:hypothetical protein
MGEAVEHLPSKQKALSSNNSTAKISVMLAFVYINKKLCEKESKKAIFYNS